MSVAAEWTADRLDLAAYLRRIGHDGDTTPTAATLAALHRAHMAAIPFENLDIPLGRGIATDLEAVEAKLVQRGRGGYCFEQNVLFAAALERLGFRVERLLARVGGETRPRTHLALRVEVDGRCWLADVGFGSSILEPLAFDEPGEQRQGAWRFRLTGAGEQEWDLLELEGDGWAPGYRLEGHRIRPADVMVSNHYTATHPGSPFVTRVVAVHKDEREVRRLVDDTYAVTRPDGSVERHTLDRDAFAATLRDVFGLPLDDEEVALLWARAGSPSPRSAPSSAGTAP